MKEYQLEVVLKDSLENETTVDLIRDIINTFEKVKTNNIDDVYISTLDYENDDFEIKYNDLSILSVEDNYINGYSSDYYLESEYGFRELLSIINNLFFNPKTSITSLQYK